MSCRQMSYDFDTLGMDSTFMSVVAVAVAVLLVVITIIGRAKMPQLLGWLIKALLNRQLASLKMHRKSAHLVSGWLSV